MEEQVGEFWHRLVTRLADKSYPQAAVTLPEVERTVSILFRALGGDGGLQVTSAEQLHDRSRRNWVQRLAGSQQKVALAWRDDSYLRLPAQLDCLPQRSLNRDLYLWLAALAVSSCTTDEDWFSANQHRTLETLARFPGLAPRYGRLVEAHIATRPAPESLRRAEAQAESAVRAALREPGSVQHLPSAKRPPSPVPLWLHPQPPGQLSAHKAADPDTPEAAGDEQRRELERLRRQAERVKTPESDRGLITVRMENIFTWGEFVNVDRGSEDEDDLDRAESIARDLDRLAVSRDAKRAAATLKFDLDLPAEAEDDLVIGEGIRLPEWDWKQQCLLRDHCRIVPMLAADAPSIPLPERLGRTARRLRNQFQALAPARVWHRAQADGQEIDIDAYLRFAADRRAGSAVEGDGLYRELRSGARDLACLLMADLSLSTDTYVDDHHRVIDVVRDSLFLFAEALDATGDRFALHGFSSRKRDPVRVHTLKTFEERYGGAVRGRISAIKPGYYTRMGAAIRHASAMLAAQPAGRRLLLLLTDGKPNDLDKYEGRYGIEDTRQAVLEARRLGLQPFCVTIDAKGNDYLPHLFGNGGYVVIRQPSELPKRLPLLYAQLTA
ncbi:MAG: VWA domain-containing protein [Chromatiaceae bacterium]|nr:VWA domain-containing protein [Chromatiaceae bacterium]HPE81413.1 VWA domain-containing protein [Gammaproteobacteria bacterium]